MTYFIRLFVYDLHTLLYYISSDPKAFVSELQENIEDMLPWYYIYSDMHSAC